MKVSISPTLQLLCALAAFLPIAIGSLTAAEAPGDIHLSKTVVPDNHPIGTTVGLLSAIPSSENHTFALVAGDGDE